MNKTKLTFFSTLLVVLLSSSAISAQGPSDGHHPMMPGPHMDDRGFDATSQHMIVSGSIVIEDVITLSISMKPDEGDIRDAKRHGMGRDPQDFENQINVSISSLAEYEDSGPLGYDPNDTIVSQYLLNNENLGEPELTENDDGSYYQISSNDGVFQMIIYIRSENGIGYAWKWSVEISYPFLSTTSKLAIIQSVESTRGPIAHRHHHMNFPQPPPHMRLNDTQIHDDHPEVPMFFKWDKYAEIDGVNETVIATVNNGEISLSLLQGNEIFYDPEVGVDIDTISSIDTYFDQFELKEFVDTINSPTGLGLLLAAGILIGTLFYTRVKTLR